MSEVKSVLSPAELEEFSKPGRFVARMIAEYRPETKENAPGQPRDLVSTITSRVKELREKAKSTWFECHCVSVRSDDGMSWSAEALRQQTVKDFPTFDMHCLGGSSRPDSLPQIADLVSVQALMKSA